MKISSPKIIISTLMQRGKTRMYFFYFFDSIVFLAAIFITLFIEPRFVFGLLFLILYHTFYYYQYDISIDESYIYVNRFYFKNSIKKIPVSDFLCERKAIDVYHYIKTTNGQYYVYRAREVRAIKEFLLPYKGFNNYDDFYSYIRKLYRS